MKAFNTQTDTQTDASENNNIITPHCIGNKIIFHSKADHPRE